MDPEDIDRLRAKNATQKVPNVTPSNLADDGPTIAEETMLYALTVNHERLSRRHDNAIPPDQPDFRDDDPVAVAPTLPRSAQGLCVNHASATAVGATVPPTRPRVDTRANRPMCKLLNHGRVWPRAVHTQHPTTLLDILSRPPEARHSRTKSSNASGPRPTTSLAYVPPRVVIMEADCLRRGVNSPSSGSSTTTNTRQGTNRTNVANDITVRGRLQVTQPTEHKVTRDWEDTRHLRVDPTRCRTHDTCQIMLWVHDFNDANTAIQTVLLLCIQHQTTGAAEDANNGETRIVSVYNDSTISHCMEGANIARRNNLRRNDTVNYLDRPQQQHAGTARDRTRETIMQTFERHGSKSSITVVQYLEEIDTGHNTNGGNATSIGHARSNYAQARHRSTKEHELLDHTLTLADPMRILKTCSVTPLDTTANEERDDRPKQMLEDEAGIEADATTRDQLPKLDSAASVAPQLTDQPNNGHWYVFPRNALEQPCSPDELATGSPTPDRHDTNACSVDRDGVRQSCHTDATRTNHPQRSQRYCPYDPTTVRASTRISRAGELPCGCSDPEHEKRHCHRNKRCTLCNSPGHAPYECLFPHSNCRDKQRCRVRAKHAHVNDNDGCPWTKAVDSKTTPRGTTPPNTSESTKSLHTLGQTQSTQSTAWSPIVLTPTRIMERIALRSVSTTTRATPPVAPRPKLPQGLVADFEPLGPRCMTSRRSHLRFPGPLRVPTHDTPIAQTQDDHRSCPTAIPNAYGGQTLTIDYRLTQSPTLDDTRATTTVTADSVTIPTSPSHSTKTTVATTATEGTTALDDYTTYHHRRDGNSIVLGNRPNDDTCRSPTTPWTSIALGPRNPLPTTRGQLGHEAKDAPSIAPIPREKAWHSVVRDHTHGKNIASDSVSTNVRTTPPSTAHPTLSRSRIVDRGFPGPLMVPTHDASSPHVGCPSVSPFPGARHAYLARPTTPSPKRPANPVPRRASPPPHNDRPRDRGSTDESPEVEATATTTLSIITTSPTSKCSGRTNQEGGVCHDHVA
ncbi:hypothetical protein EDB89DRAFT_2203061 [Lactarius sanguifluus]|nr:hypothetical protein EDB89DRAFT_2203061 [Lactarius sanguifluus]